MSFSGIGAVSLVDVQERQPLLPDDEARNDGGCCCVCGCCCDCWRGVCRKVKSKLLDNRIELAVALLVLGALAGSAVGVARLLKNNFVTHQDRVACPGRAVDHVIEGSDVR
jgi:hypothetical protein